MQLQEIYVPIRKELKKVEDLLSVSLGQAENKSILELNQFLLDAAGKMIRPALVVLCSRAVSRQKPSITDKQLIKIASSVELIHMASLIHDDVIDHSLKRHNKDTVNKRFGEDVSIALGDYLYAKAFELIASCFNADVFSCLSQATRLMCEGELIQVCERDNLSLLKERYILIIKKKTAALFMASCQAGARLSNCPAMLENAIKQYGLNFGIAFQVADDCLDLIGQEKALGKPPGADFRMGELTLPVLNLLSENKDKDRIMDLVRKQNDPDAFKELRRVFVNSPAFTKTKEEISGYIQKAKQGLNRLDDSHFKNSLLSLADFVGQRIG